MYIHQYIHIHVYIYIYIYVCVYLPALEPTCIPESRAEAWWCLHMAAVSDRCSCGLLFTLVSARLE